MNTDRSPLAESLRVLPPLWVQTEEDSQTTLRGLQENVRGHVMCIASGGDTAFDLLAMGAEQVTAIDINPSQIAVTELKARLLERLTLREFMLFWTRRDIQSRAKVYEGLRSSLSLSTRNITDSWLTEIGDVPLIARGRMQGVAEELAGRFPEIAALVRDWFNTRTLDAQREFHERHLQNLSSLIADLRQSRAETWFGTGAKAKTDNRIAEQMKQRFRERFYHLVRHIEVCSNPYAAHMMLGHYLDDARPLYLTGSGYLAAQKSIKRLALREGNAIDVLREMESAHLSGGDISNISDYLSKDDIDRLFDLLRSRVGPAGTVVHRNLILDMPPRIADGFSRDLELSRTLHAEDRSFVYLAVTVDRVFP